MERSPRSSPRADRSEAPPDPFGAPAVPVEPGAAPTELIGFVVQRLLRVGSAALVMVVLGEFVRPAGGALQALFLVAFAVGVWTPTSAVLFRVRFLRSPHEDEHDPGPRATVVRALTAEHVVGSVPLLVAAGFAMRFLGPTGLAVGLLAVAIVGRKLWQSVVTMERHLAALERVDERFDAAALRLRRLERWTVGRGRDAARSDLAQTLQLTGRIDDAVAALERISDPVGHRVPAKLARLVVAADPGRALAVAEAAALSGPDRLVVEVLAALHSWEGAVPAAQIRALDAALESASEAQHGQLALLLGASLAPTDPAQAAAALSDGAWSPDDLPWLERLWPGVARPLGALPGWRR